MGYASAKKALLYEPPLSNKGTVRLFLISAIFAIATQSNSNNIVRGIVVDDSTGSPIAKANVIILGTPFGSITNDSGEFVLSRLNYQQYQVQVSAIGYRSLIKNCFPMQSSTELVEFPLKPCAIPMPGITITRERSHNKVLADPRGYSGKIITATHTLRAVGVLEDALRYYTKFPSIQQRTDLNSLLYIRGGSPDQNLILIDDVPILNPYAMRLSMGGAVSFINRDLLQYAELLDDGFSVRYGNRLSSVINVKYREGNKERFKWNSNINLISGAFSVQGPVMHGKGSYITSFGTTYLEPLMNLANSQKRNMIVPSRHQIHGKFVYYFDSGNKLSIVAISERESSSLKNYRPENMALDSGSRTQVISLHHDLVLDPKLFAATTYSWYRDNNKLNFFDASNLFHGGKLNFSSSIGNLREEVIWQPGSSMRAVLGTEITFGKYFLDWGLNWRSAADLPLAVSFKDYEKQFALYLENALKVSAKTSLILGLRRSFSTNFPSPMYSPRIRLQSYWNQSVRSSISLGIYYQYPSIFSTILRGTPIDISTNFGSLRPEKALYVDYGTHIMLSNNLTFEVHNYYRKLSNILLADESLVYSASNSGEGYAKGIECQLRNLEPLMSHFSLYLAYGWARSRYHIKEGEWIFFDHDREHSISCSFKWEFSKYFSTEASWRFGTGFPFTPVVGAGYAPYFWRSDPSGWYFVKGAKNSARLPSYHKSDIRFTYASRVGKRKIDVYIEVANLYNRKNVFIYDWDIDHRDSSTIPSISKVPIFMMPLIPMIGISICE